ncbi:MAG: helix-turn-helix transcriptional regulator [Saprospiraceae bacterium]|nr:helix-turn-helix transcriptional regulator [Saprospiraceae bacterium]
MTSSAYSCNKRRPSGHLAQYVDHIYFLKGSMNNIQKDQPWFPVGSMDLVFDLGASFEQGTSLESLVQRPGAFAAGLYEQGIRIRPTGRIDQVGIVFRPGKFRFFTKESQDHYKGRITPMEEIFGMDAEQLQDKLTLASQEEDRLEIIHRFLEVHLRADLVQNYFMDYCIERMQKSSGTISIASLAEKGRTSPRHFRRMFKEYVGISPKLYAMMMRIQRVLTLTMIPSMDLTVLSHQLGYYDYSHFSRDFKGMTGMTISDFCSEQELITKTVIKD